MRRIDNGTAVHGILLANKPQGLSSNIFLQKIKALYGAQKAGHTGTLDPLATGMIAICFGEATKFCQYLIEADKNYQVTGLLGTTTDTGDAWGTVIETTPAKHITEQEVCRTLKQFEGKIQQVPPMYSALKYRGQPLYKYARKGLAISRESREIIIHQLNFINLIDGCVELEVSCSKGTYIRSLVEDIGKALGVGAHVTKLHRAYTASFRHTTMYTLEELQNKPQLELLKYLLPIETVLNRFPSIVLSSEEITCLRQGKLVTNRHPQVEQENELRVYDEQTRFIGLVTGQKDGYIRVKRLLSQTLFDQVN